jgi:hypothetical protein
MFTAAFDEAVDGDDFPRLLPPCRMDALRFRRAPLTKQQPMHDRRPAVPIPQPSSRQPGVERGADIAGAQACGAARVGCGCSSGDRARTP